MSNSDRYERGAAVMRQLFGGLPQPGAMPADFLDITVENLFGDIWTRPGLELRDRSVITVAALTVLGREPELRVHLRGALNLGVSQQALEEMMIHLAHYGGWPTGVAGLRAVREVVAARADSATNSFDAITKS